MHLANIFARFIAQVIPIGEPIPAISASPGDDTGGGEDRLFNLFQGAADK